MRVLLLSMPDTADVLDFGARFANLAIVSLAGNLPGHDVKVLDLVLSKPHVKKALKDALEKARPQLVGLSAMTFQFDTMLRVANYIREWDSTVKIAAGGYHTTLMARELAENGTSLPLDFLVRGEAEETFAELLTELERATPDLEGIKGLSYRHIGHWNHNPDRPLCDLSNLALPNRKARLSGGYYLLHLPMDVAETSRGCPYNCKFCSITKMYGKTFRAFPEERVVEDLKNIRDQGAKVVFFVDDNITYDIEHFRKVCRAIIAHGLNDMSYVVQATAVGIAQNPELVAEMDRANFRYVFVGFESMTPTALKEMNKPTNPEINSRAARLLKQHGMAIIAGFIVGYPEDTKESVNLSFRLLKELKYDMLYAQYLTPYPKTALRQEMLEAGLVANLDNYKAYDGFTCNIRTRHLSQKALYRSLKSAVLRSNFDLSLITNNYFLRKCPRPFLKAILKSMITNVYNVIAARQRNWKMDI